jgi:flagellar biosynthesis/type III secretory pathway M-ring protein FliF/YscJ
MLEQISLLRGWQPVGLFNIVYFFATWIIWVWYFVFLLKLLFEELLERAKEKEEKEAKKRQRLADDFTNLLYSFKVDEDSTSDLIHISQYLAK